MQQARRPKGFLSLNAEYEGELSIVYEELVCCDSTKAVIVNSSSEQNV